MTNALVERYVDPTCQYDFWLRPDDVTNLAEARQRGMNCVVLAHLVIKDLFSYDLPTDLRCTEMYLDTKHLIRHDEVEPTSLRQGDLLWFGTDAPRHTVQSFSPRYDNDGHLENWREFPVNHVGIFTGEYIEQEPQVLHSVAGENTTVWPLKRFAEHPRYQTVWGVSRLAVLQATAS